MNSLVIVQVNDDQGKVWYLVKLQEDEDDDCGRDWIKNMKLRSESIKSAQGKKCLLCLDDAVPSHFCQLCQECINVFDGV